MKSRKKKRKNQVKKGAVQRANRLEHLSGKMHIPCDTVADSAILSIYGTQCLRIENYGGILDYNDQQVEVATKNCNIRIEGRKLELSYCSDEEVCVTGQLKQIQYYES